MVSELVRRRSRSAGYITLVKTKYDNHVSLMMCTECGHISENEKRYKEHLKEPRHINNYRDLAYKGKIFRYFQIKDNYNLVFDDLLNVQGCINFLFSDPKKRQLWLKVWFDKLEKAESTNANDFELSEEDEFEANCMLENCDKFVDDVVESSTRTYPKNEVSTTVDTPHRNNILVFDKLTHHPLVCSPTREWNIRFKSD